MQLLDNIYQSKIMLTDEIPLFVYLVKGSDWSALIDSGVRTMFPVLVESLKEAKADKSGLRFILHTHSHHDHIGCNRQLKDLTGCLIAAHPFYEAWHRDFDIHYREFALMFPEILNDNPELRHEVFDPLDGPVPLDLTIDEGVTFHLGGGTVLEAFRFPGHMKAELGYFERKEKTLILGDAITGLNWEIFHSHLDVQAYRDSLCKIRKIIADKKIKTVLLSHFGQKTPEEAVQLTRDAETYINQIEYTILCVFSEKRGVTLQYLWTEVCKRMKRKPDFRALNMVNAHIEDLLQRRIIVEVGEREYSLLGAACQ